MRRRGEPHRNSFSLEDGGEFWKLVKRAGDDECWLWLGAKTSCGYGQVKVGGKSVTASKAAWIFMHGDPGNAHVLHSCHNRLCVNPEHLHLGFHAQNMQEMGVAGRAYRANGESNGNARLTAEMVRAIRADTRKQRFICADYGIGSSTLSQIRSRKRWAHIED